MPKFKWCTLAVLAVSIFIAAEAYAFKIISKNGKEIRWTGSSVEYYLHEDDPASFNKEGWDGAGQKVTFPEIIDLSFATWKNTSDVDIDYKYKGRVGDRLSGDDGKNVISFIPSGWESLAFDPPSSALAVTVTTYDNRSGKIVDTDIYFNGDYYAWGHIDSEYEKTANIVDIQNIATHEIGHFFGLDHPSENPVEAIEEFRYATMYYSSSAGDISRRQLNEDDENAIRHLYPSKAFEQSLPSPELDYIYPGHGVNNGTEVWVTLKGANFGPTTMIKLVGPTRDDTVCKMVNYTPQSAECVFDLYYTNKGEYDIVVANAYRKETVLKGAFTVYGREIEQPASGGGCGAVDLSGTGGFSFSLLGIMILIFPITVIYLRKKRYAEVFLENRAQVKRRSCR